MLLGFWICCHTAEMFAFTIRTFRDFRGLIGSRRGNWRRRKPDGGYRAILGSCVVWVLAVVVASRHLPHRSQRILRIRCEGRSPGSAERMLLRPAGRPVSCFSLRLWAPEIQMRLTWGS